MRNGYTYSQNHATRTFYCSKKDAGCRPRVKLDDFGKIVDVKDDHSHDPPRYMVTASGRYFRM